MFGKQNTQTQETSEGKVRKQKTLITELNSQKRRQATGRRIQQSKKLKPIKREGDQRKIGRKVAKQK